MKETQKFRDWNRKKTRRKETFLPSKNFIGVAKKKYWGRKNFISVAKKIS